MHFQIAVSVTKSYRGVLKAYTLKSNHRSNMYTKIRTDSRYNLYVKTHWCWVQTIQPLIQQRHLKRSFSRTPVSNVYTTRPSKYHFYLNVNYSHHHNRITTWNSYIKFIKVSYRFFISCRHLFSPFYYFRR